MKRLSKQAYKDRRILSELEDNVKKNKQITDIVINCLPDEFKSSIKQSQLMQNSLTIIVSNQTLASKLRYHLAQLKYQLKGYSEFKSLRKIKLHIIPEHKHKTATTKSIKQSKPIYSPVYSKKASNLLKQFSKSIDNSELQLSLQKLAQHVQKKS